MTFGEALAGKSGVCEVKVEFGGRVITSRRAARRAVLQRSERRDTPRIDLDGARGSAPLDNFREESDNDREESG